MPFIEWFRNQAAQQSAPNSIESMPAAAKAAAVEAARPAADMMGSSGANAQPVPVSPQSANPTPIRGRSLGRSM
jgi:hypothetical protein